MAADDYEPRVGDLCYWLDDGPEVFVMVEEARARSGGGRPMCLVAEPLNSENQDIRRALPLSLRLTNVCRLRHRRRR